MSVSEDKNGENKAPIGADEDERVIILHGATGSYTDMIQMEYALLQEGYEVHNWDYPSTTLTVKECAEYLVQRNLRSVFNSSAKKTHFVGFSMGGLVVEEILENFRPENLGRVVSIGTPHHGSEVADFMKSNPLNRQYYDFVFGPAGGDLTTAFRQAVLAGVQNIDYDLGCISGDVNKGYIISRHLFKGQPNDGRVAVYSSQHPHMKDHVIVPANHADIKEDDDAIRHVVNFLKDGQFKPKP